MRLAVGIILVTTAANAAQLLSSVNTDDFACICGIYSRPAGFRGPQTDYDVTAGSVAEGIEARMFGSAAAGFGVLRSMAGISYQSYTGNNRLESHTRAMFIDVITIDFAPLNGARGTFNILYDLEGSIASFGAVSPLAGVRAIQLQSGESAAVSYDTGVSGRFQIPRTFSFTFGDPFQLQFELCSSAAVQLPLAGAACGGAAGVRPGTTGSATVDFSNTFYVRTLVIAAQDGTPITNALISTGSGVNYLNQSETPEPSTLVLFGIAAIIACVCRKRLQRTGIC